MLAGRDRLVCKAGGLAKGLGLLEKIGYHSRHQYRPKHAPHRGPSRAARFVHARTGPAGRCRSRTCPPLLYYRWVVIHTYLITTLLVTNAFEELPTQPLPNSMCFGNSKAPKSTYSVILLQGSAFAPARGSSGRGANQAGTSTSAVAEPISSASTVTCTRWGAQLSAPPPLRIALGAWGLDNKPACGVGSCTGRQAS